MRHESLDVDPGTRAAINHAANLGTDDALDGERRRYNLPAAIELAQRPGQLHIEPGAELPHPCPHLWDDRAPDCHPWEHCCGYGTHCPRHNEEGDAA